MLVCVLKELYVSLVIVGPNLYFEMWCMNQTFCLHFDHRFFSFAVNSETIADQNGKPLSLNSATDSTESDFVIIKSDSPPAEIISEDISEIPEPTIQKEEVKAIKKEKMNLFGKTFKKKAEPPADVKSVQEKEMLNEDQMDESPPATDPQLVSKLFVFYF